MEEPSRPNRSPVRPRVSALAAACALLIGLVWLGEAIDPPHLFFGAPPAPFCWPAAALRSAVVLLVGIPAGILLVRLSGREAEKELAERAEHLHRAQEVASLGSWRLDLAAGELYWSDEVFRLFGVPPGTGLEYSTFIDAVLPEDREYVDRSWREALEGGPYDIEHRILVGGEVKWVRERAEVEFDASGRAVRGTGIVQDITPRKSAEEEAARLQAELDHVTRVATLSEFSSALAHELNQPLAAILSNAQAALRFLDVDPPDLAELREILEDVVRDDQRARDVILKLREMFRKSAGRRAFARLEVNPLVEDVLRIAKGDLAMRRVSLETDLGSGLPSVTGDAVQLRQVLLNLVLNALEAMERTPAPRLSLRTRNGTDGGGVQIEVADTGPGIAPGEESRLFQPFFTTKEHGMGMGLAVSRAIVEAHGGRIGVSGNGDVTGVRFVITLPASGEGP